MNIFVLDECACEAARLQCDKHVPKMVVESAQMLSTVHRMLDGTETRIPSKSGKRMVKAWIMDDPDDDALLYKAVHMNHPCTVWSRVNRDNYQWHWLHFKALCDEFTYRYGKVHASETRLLNRLKKYPKNLPHGKRTSWPLAMGSNPECMFPNDPVKSYRMFYQTKQNRFNMNWTKRSVPNWFEYK
jgi:hypothetical protein